MVRKSCLMLAALVTFLLLMPLGARTEEKSLGMILGGTSSAPIKMEVFSDFECPGCRMFYLEIVRPLLRDYSSIDKVCVIYYEYPLAQHKYAPGAARYCEAAYMISRDMALRVIDALFVNQADWKIDGNVEKVIAKALSPQEFKKLKSNLRDPAIDKAIKQGMQLGKTREVNSTPTMFAYYWGKSQKVESPHLLVYKYFKQDFLDKILR